LTELPGAVKGLRFLATSSAGYLTLGALVGLALGAGGFTFFYGRGFSYLGHDAATCANCHVMRDHYAGWLRASHHGTAV
jgi:cytochrome c nitrite reductase small subunit